jgi:hypothetical protein
MSDKIDEKTQVETVSLDEINDILDIGGEIMLPNEEAAKPNVFSNTTPDMTFLEKPVDENVTVVEEEKQVDDEVSPVETTSVVDTEDLLAPPTDDTLVDEDDDASKTKGGRPTAIVSATKSLIEKGLITPFVDDNGKEEDVSNYTAGDFEELFEANFKRQQEDLSESLPAQFFQNMPVEMQQAYHYIANGGQDLKSLFKAMGQSQEVKEINVETESGQAYAVRTYLQATNYGTPEEIEDEVQSLMDRGDLEKKANQFKPKLDAMQDQMIQQRLARQEQDNKQRQEQSQMYMENVYNVLEKKELNGVQLDDRTQNMLYAGLVQPNYPSINGKQTNLLGHLLEKHQWVEPRHDLIAEALWLLSDPDTYRSKIRETGEKQAVEKTVRKLKDAQSNLSSTSITEEPKSTPKAKRTMQKPKRNFFAR